MSALKMISAALILIAINLNLATASELDGTSWHFDGKLSCQNGIKPELNAVHTMQWSFKGSKFTAKVTALDCRTVTKADFSINDNNIILKNEVITFGSDCSPSSNKTVARTSDYMGHITIQRNGLMIFLDNKNVECPDNAALYEMKRD